MRRFRNALRDPGSAAREMRFLREQYLTRAGRCIGVLYVYACMYICMCALRHEKRARNRIGIRRFTEFPLSRRYRVVSIFRYSSDFSLYLSLTLSLFFPVMSDTDVEFPCFPITMQQMWQYVCLYLHRFRRRSYSNIRIGKNKPKIYPALFLFCCAII